MNRFVCDLLGADEGGIGGYLRLDLRFGQPRRIALPRGVLLAKFGIDRVSKVRPGSGIGPILRVRDPPTERTPRPDNRAGQKIWASLASTDVSVDPFDQTTKSGADHDTDADVAVINPRTDSTFSPLSASGAKRRPTTGIDDDEHHRLYATRWAAAGSRSTIWTVDARDAQPSFDRLRLVSRF